MVSLMRNTLLSAFLQGWYDLSISYQDVMQSESPAVCLLFGLVQLLSSSVSYLRYGPSVDSFDGASTVHLYLQHFSRSLDVSFTNHTFKLSVLDAAQLQNAQILVASS